MTLLLDVAVFGKRADQVDRTCAWTGAVEFAEFCNCGDGAFTLLAGDAQPLDHGADEAGELLGLFLDESFGGGEGAQEFLTSLPMKTIAHALVERGVALLRADDGGVDGAGQGDGSRLTWAGIDQHDVFGDIVFG